MAGAAAAGAAQIGNTAGHAMSGQGMHVGPCQEQTPLVSRAQ